MGVIETKRVVKVSSKGNKYEVISVSLIIDDKVYNLSDVYLDDTKKGLLDMAGIKAYEINQ